MLLFFFSIYCMWEHKPSVCVKLQLSSRTTALKKKKKKVDLKGCLWSLFVSSFKFSIIQQSEGVGGCSGGPSCPWPQHPLAGGRRFIFQHHSCPTPSCKSFSSSLYRSRVSDGTINVGFNSTALQYSAILQFLCVVLENELQTI